MTDPIQWTNPQQQQQGSFANQAGLSANQAGLSANQAGQQQSYVDDILGWDDIFSTIPEAEDDLPYGDMLEKRYQFEPITEEEEKVIPPVTVAAPQIPTAPQMVKPPVVEITHLEPIAAEEIQQINKKAGLEAVQVNTLLDTKLQTDVQKKFGELFFTTKRIYELKEKLWVGGQENFDILWADNDKVFISYRFLLDETSEPILFITKVEQDKETDEETENELRFAFNEETSSLEVMVNNILLFDEIQDFTADAKKKMQVSEKLNKFIFLAWEEQKKLEREIQAKEEEERERRKLQDIFRNF